MEGLPACGGPARLWRACPPYLLFAFRSGGLQFTLSLEGPGAPRRSATASPTSPVPNSCNIASVASRKFVAFLFRRPGLQPRRKASKINGF